jgi:hypothetical protein
MHACRYEIGETISGRSKRNLPRNREQDGYTLGILITAAPQEEKLAILSRLRVARVANTVISRALAVIVVYLSRTGLAPQKKLPRASFSDFFARLFSLL